MIIYNNILRPVHDPHDPPCPKSGGRDPQPPGLTPLPSDIVVYIISERCIRPKVKLPLETWSTLAKCPQFHFFAIMVVIVTHATASFTGIQYMYSSKEYWQKELTWCAIGPTSPIELGTSPVSCIWLGRELAESDIKVPSEHGAINTRFTQIQWDFNCPHSCSLILPKSANTLDSALSPPNEAEAPPKLNQARVFLWLLVQPKYIIL